jgi:hypothetical protein
MRVCKCGGTIRQHGLTNNREAWTCNACGRYEVLELYGQRQSTRNLEPSEDGVLLLSGENKRSSLHDR